jgi:hypothetical protein
VDDEREELSVLVDDGEDDPADPVFELLLAVGPDGDARVP